MGKALRCFGLVVVAGAAMSCGDVIRNSRAPVLLVINTLQGAPGNHPSQFSNTLVSSVITNVTSPAPCSPTSPCPVVFDDSGSVQLSIVPKDPTIQPSAVNAVTLTRYHVDFSRADGRNTPGVDVPFGFDGAATATVGGNVSTTITFELVRHVMKEESPLVQINSNQAVIISTIATVTFYGADLVGNAISVSGTILIEFGFFPNA